MRQELVDGDYNAVLMYLMRYPPKEDITPILDIADMIRRCVDTASSCSISLSSVDVPNRVYILLTSNLFSFPIILISVVVIIVYILFIRLISLT